MRTIIILFCLFALPAAAYVFGGSNLGFMGYPEPECAEPYKPFEFTDEWARNQFVAEGEDFLSCVQDYVDNADNDVKRVMEARDAAVEAANRFVDSI